jgi:hypothetical protein
MRESVNSVMTARCACGSVEVEARGAPIICAVCYCDDCQEAARRIEAGANGPPLQDPDGGTAMVVYRKDRVSCTKGVELLKRIKIREASPTGRLVASCCNSAMLLTFDDFKHWVDVYLARVVGDAPRLQMRTCTKFRRPDAAIATDVPSYRRYPIGLLMRLLAARIAMIFDT